MATEEVIRIMCPNLACKRVLAVPTSARGKLVRCKGCAINIRIPMPKAEAPAADASQPGQAAQAQTKPAA